MDMLKIKEKMNFFFFFFGCFDLKGGKVVPGMLGFEMCVFESVVDCKL